MRHLLLLLSATPLLFSEQVSHSLSFQGFTGLINIPNAQVMNEGDIAVAFNNQYDWHLHNYDYSHPEKRAEDYLFGVGFLPNLEMQGRLKEQNWRSGGIRDLSANFKYKIPRFFESDYFPDIAVGVQDIGSAANNYENYYIVADETFWKIRASLGYGYSHNSRAPRMDGLFGGVEAQLLPWVALIGEYDGKEKHAGARFSMPESWMEAVNFNMTVASNLDNDNEMSVMFNATFPLGKHEKYVAETRASDGLSFSSALDEKEVAETSRAERVDSDENTSLEALARVIGEDGLQNVTVGSRGKTLYIAYENTVYLHNEIDAIAAVLRKAIALSTRYDTFTIASKHSNITVFSLSGSLTKAQAFYTHPSYLTKVAFQASLHESEGGDTSSFDMAVKNENDGRFRPRIELTPLLTTFVGTEVGVFDYQLLVGVGAYVNLYKGLDLTMRYTIPVSNSDELDPYDGQFGYAYSDGGLYSAMLNYSTKIGDGINTLSAGSLKYDYWGVVDQYMYCLGDHTLKLKAGYFLAIDDSDYYKEFYLAKYTYHYTPLDLFAEVEGGQYWYFDRGFSVALKRYFNDVAVELKYLQTSGSSNHHGEYENKYAGVSIEIPLDFRKSKLSGKHFQLNGNTSWKYGLKSTVGRKDGTNTIVVGNGYNPTLSIESEKYFYNRNRTSLNYIKENVERFLDVF